MNRVLKGFGGGHSKIDDKLYDTSSNTKNKTQDANSVNPELHQEPRTAERHVAFGHKNAVPPAAEPLNEEPQPEMLDQQQASEGQSSGMKRHVGILKKLFHDGGISPEDRN
jgi:hypothetical protein